MLGTMRRREDDLLAISPPPEFQDIAIASTSSSVPPPQDFRDLSPSPGSAESRLLFSTENAKALKDFADKISFNILNEAMIIATIIPQAGVSGMDFRSHHLSVPTGGKFSSDSYDSSSATSWEYLPEIEEHLDSHNFVRNSKRYPLPSSTRRLHKRSLRKSNSESTALRTMDVHVQAASPTEKSESLSGISSRSNQTPSKQELQLKRHSVADVTKLESSGNNECYTLPFECDIYSLPVDNIPNPGDPSSTTTFPSNRAFRHRPRGDKEQENLRISMREFEPVSGSSSNGKGTASTVRTETSRGIKIRNSQRQRNSLDLSVLPASIENVVPRVHELSERNNNEEHGRSRKKRRSKGIDIENQDSHNVTSSQATAKTIENNNEKEKRTLGSSFLNLFRRTRSKTLHLNSQSGGEDLTRSSSETLQPSRALPLPPVISEDSEQSFTPTAEGESLALHMQSTLEPRDFATRIEKAKDCGWYWGPLSSQGAEDLLRGEPDGSFIVRDSSDVHYIFSLTFKLNGLIRHVRIEHDQGNFSFGPLTRFKAATIVDFVEKAVAHSRSGRYLFFLHRRPILGPMRVQLLHPYSRFIHARSLQHMCRFVILKNVRRDLVNRLPLPNPLIDYLNTPQYYFENNSQSDNPNPTPSPKN